MGTIRLCGNKINIADDDLGFLMFSHLLIRILTLFALIGCLSAYTKVKEATIPLYSSEMLFERRFTFSAFTIIQFSVLTVLVLVGIYFDWLSVARNRGDCILIPRSGFGNILL